MTDAEAAGGRREVERASVTAWVMLVVLFLAYICSTLDRALIGVLVEPIKHHLAVTDTQLSLLQGLAFSLVFAVATIGIGTFIDRVSRVAVVRAGVLIWSLMTAFCGIAASFTLMFIGRAGVGLSEAALGPAAYSLVAQIFPKKKLGIAFGVFTSAGVIGTGLSSLVGGYLFGAFSERGTISLPVLGPLEPWQLTFLTTGLGGLLLMPLLFALREPRQGSVEGVGTLDVRQRGDLMAFYRQRGDVIAFHHLGVILATLTSFGGSLWIVPLFMRLDGWTVSGAGTAVGGVIVAAGLVGLMGGGALSDVAARRGAHMRMVVCACAVVLGACAAITCPLVESPHLRLALFGIFAACAALPNAVGNAALQLITPPKIRGSVSAVFLFGIGIGNIVGPTAIAFVSDTFFPSATGLRYSFAIVLPAFLASSATMFLLCARRYPRWPD